jgi:hypothetical protein
MLTTFAVFAHLAGANAEPAQQLAYPLLPAANRRGRTAAMRPEREQLPRRARSQSKIHGTGTSHMASKANLKSSGREAALARRKAMSTRGKQGARSSAPERTRNLPHVAKAAPRAAETAPARASNPQPSPPRQSTAAQPSLSSPAPVRNGARASRAPQSPSEASRALARKRRAALAHDGRRAQRGPDRVRSAQIGGKGAASQPASASRKSGDCGCGGQGKRDAAPQASLSLSQFAHQPGAPVSAAARSSAGLGQAKANGLRSKKLDAALGAKPAGRMQSLARRAALSSRGKSANGGPQSTASLARQANPKLTGRELAQKVRSQRSSNGGAGERKSPPVGRVHPNKRKALQGATDQPWKVAVSETALGQQITGTKVGRSVKTTGDEPSTCRQITGTEYMGADIFRAFCQAEPATPVAKVRVSPTGHGQRVTGNEVGRSGKVTGDEPGTCKNITGTEYLSPNQYEAFCGVRPEPGPTKVGQARTRGDKPVSGTLVGRATKVTGDELGAEIKPTGTQYTSPSDIGTEIAPAKVGLSKTLSGGDISGTRVGRSTKVTGDEPGSCRLVTGDEYVDLAQYQACRVEAQPEPPKVGRSATQRGLLVSGTQTGRSGRVTGDEPGTCKAITGTPYAGLEQAAQYCEAPQQEEIKRRTRPLAMTPGPSMTGLQPGLSRPDAGGRSFGGGMTGAAKGACEPLTGTPYVGRDQFAEACGGSGAQPGEGDFPRAIDTDGSAEAAGWQKFSVSSPAQEALAAKARSGSVTGTAYESSRHITGPFGMATGKITGTEQARFDMNRPRPDLMRMQPPSAAAGADASDTESAEAARARVTGEGQSAGLKITGDDWDRGERITGTEGVSARRRNPTRPGAMSAMPPMERKRNEETAQPVSRVTGAAGSTDRGALITYSGGARG